MLPAIVGRDAHAAPPWDTLWWTPRIHLALFVTA